MPKVDFLDTKSSEERVDMVKVRLGLPSEYIALVKNTNINFTKQNRGYSVLSRAVNEQYPHMAVKEYMYTEHDGATHVALKNSWSDEMLPGLLVCYPVDYFVKHGKEINEIGFIINDMQVGVFGEHGRESGLMPNITNFTG